MTNKFKKKLRTAIMLGLLGLLTVVCLLALQSKSAADGITAANNHRQQYRANYV